MCQVPRSLVSLCGFLDLRAPHGVTDKLSLAFLGQVFFDTAKITP